MAMTHNLLAKSYRVFLFDEREDYERAIQMLSAHLMAHARDGLAYNNRGLAHSEIGQGDEALLDFAKAIECSPADPMPYINRGELYLRARPTPRLQEAIDDFTQAIALDDSDATFHRCRAHACVKANRIQDAIDSFGAAIQLEPDFGYTYFERGQLYQQIGEEAKAEQDLAMARKLPQFRGCR